MIIPMLEAISSMMKDTKETEVKCAKIMLDKVIEGMKDKHIPTVEIPTLIDTTPRQVLPPKLKKDDYQIIVDKNQKIVSIKNLPLDAKVELDGVVMTHQESLGKTFVSGKVL